MIWTFGCFATTSLIPSSRFLVFISVTVSRTFRIFPLSPINLMRSSQALMAAPLISVATVKPAGVGRVGLSAKRDDQDATSLQRLEKPVGPSRITGKDA